MPRRLLDRIGRALDLARLFELPAWHPDRMIAAQLVLYLGLAIIIALTMWSHWRAASPVRSAPSQRRRKGDPSC